MISLLEHLSFYFSIQLTDILSSSTIYIEGVVAKLIIGVGCLEQQSIRTELLLWNLPDTFIVFITLFRIREEAVGFRTQKLS